LIASWTYDERISAMHVTDLELSPSALACLHQAGIAEVDQLASQSASELIARGFGAAELYEVVCRLNERDRTLTPLGASYVRLPQARHRELFRLRVVEGLTLDELAERVDLSPETINAMLRKYFGLYDRFIPTVEARQWAARARRRRRFHSRQSVARRPKGSDRRGRRHLTVIRGRGRGGHCGEPPPDAA
jgi:DNA-binding CsgD family transcriptional regulator